MTFQAAIRTGLPLWRKNKGFRYCRNDYWASSTGWVLPGPIDPDYLLSCIILTKEDILAKDWKVHHKKDKSFS